MHACTKITHKLTPTFIQREREHPCWCFQFNKAPITSTIQSYETVMDITDNSLTPALIPRSAKVEMLSLVQVHRPSIPISFEFLRWSFFKNLHWRPSVLKFKIYMLKSWIRPFAHAQNALGDKTSRQKIGYGPCEFHISQHMFKWPGFFFCCRCLGLYARLLVHA